MSSPYWERHNPSFSSSLLDAIYKSIEQEEEEYMSSGMTMRKSSREDMASFRRIEKWMDKKAATHHFNRNVSSTSSDSSSSDSPSTLHTSSTVKSTSSSTSTSTSTSSSSCSTKRTTLQRPKPIRTPKYTQEQPKKQHREGGFVKTKSRALKIYSDLKQPISPGGRISNFLNSMFSPKKPNYSKSGTCSSASSLSRSCLSKTPSSRSNSNKRSVRFYPVSVIVDEHCRPCGHKNLDLYSTTSIDDQHVLEEKRRLREAAMDLLKNYRQNHIQIKDDSQELDEVDDDDDEEYDDDASCASSDLFELDNLSSIGVDKRYIQELPVYETTHLPTNQRIANAFIL